MFAVPEPTNPPEMPTIMKRKTPREKPERTSAMLAALAYGSESERITLGEFAGGLRHRVIGFSMLVFALPCCLPMPPGIPTVCGVVISVIGLHLVFGRERLWLPRWIARRSLARTDLRRMVDRALPWIERFERLCRPRLVVATEAFAKSIIGLVVLLLGLILVLPIPFLGNLPPGIAATVIALGISERDGIVTLAGLVLAALAIGLSSGMAWAALEGLQYAFW